MVTLSFLWWWCYPSNVLCSVQLENSRLENPSLCDASVSWFMTEIINFLFLLFSSISNSRVYFTRLSMLSTCCLRHLSIHIHCMWLTESVILFPSMALKIFVPTNPNQGLYFDYYFASAIPLLLLTKIISSSARLMLVNSSYAYTANILLRFNKVK